MLSFSDIIHANVLFEVLCYKTNFQISYKGASISNSRLHVYYYSYIFHRYAFEFIEHLYARTMSFTNLKCFNEQNRDKRMTENFYQNLISRVMWHLHEFYQ
jgi:hypothetical protein